ncbi:helix-turn-helix domain-containing protein [Streptomyces sp. YGL11-2]|uniref:helix-turn-helix domain-containing protein n=1 Tax=Streptomyces sp. YGL11-2 TaxID=3414028 RepID=UPI003CEEB938
MQREFNVERLRRVRQVRDIPKKIVADRVGITPPRVSAWFAGDATPPAETLPALARALGEDIDDLFPRTGAPDLRDLRCDAGIRLRDVPEIIGTRSSVPVKNAERGVKRLDDAYAERLAAACGVTVEDLRASEDRSFGEETASCAAPQAHSPATLAEKITHFLEHLPADDRPSDAAIAAAVNVKAGNADVVRPSQIRDLRTGAKSAEELLAQVPEQVLYEGLGEVFTVPPHTFQSDEEVVQQIMENVRFLANNRQQGAELHLRGEGLSTGMLAKLNSLVEEFRDEESGKADR